MAWSAYFDESETGKPAIFSVAGYIFDSERAAAMHEPWNAILAEYGLPYFHMVDCAHGSGTCAHLHSDKPARVELQTRIMDVLKAHAMLGLCVSIDMSLAKRVEEIQFPGYQHKFDPYTFCCYWILMRVAAEAQDLDLREDIAYLFEAGAKHQTQANRLMEYVFKNKRQAKRYRYAGHAFIPKAQVAAVQAADILAWQWTTDHRRKLNGEGTRADLASLMDGLIHNQCHLNDELLTSNIRRFRQASKLAAECEKSMIRSRWKVLPNGQVALLPPLPMV